MLARGHPVPPLVFAVDDAEELLDRDGAGVRAVRAEDVEATIYSALGIDYSQQLADPSGRGFQYVPFSEFDAYGPINELFS